MGGKKNYEEIDFDEFWESEGIFGEEDFPEASREPSEPEPSFSLKEDSFSLEKFLLLELDKGDEE